jgi:NADH dehydrogenase
VIGEGVVPELLARGHDVRLASRSADEHAREWPGRVETITADVTDVQALEAAAQGCDVAIHVTGIVDESPPEITFARINVDGVRNSLTAALRAGIGRFVFVSSLGAERGTSAYHRSKAEGERLVRAYDRDWVIVRPGNVYGPGDQMMSTLLRLTRTLPAIPLVDRGRQRFQPIWYRDLGRALACSVDASDVAARVLEVSGDEVTSMTDLLDRLKELTGKSPVRLPIPSLVVSAATRVAAVLGLQLPINPSKLTMMLEENVIEPPASNALTATFGVTPTPLADGLRMLADAAPEQLPGDGVGTLERKRYWAVIEGSRYRAAELMPILRERITELIPIEFAAEPGTPQVIERGVTLTAALPLRGNIQMRVEEVASDRFTFATLAGHPLAGVVSFGATDVARGLEFEVTVHARAANPFDWLAMQTVGKAAQQSNWEDVVAKVVALSDGTARRGVESEVVALDEEATARTEDWIVALVSRRKRAERVSAT